MKIYLVGGAVRDMILDLPVKERDYVVVGAAPNQLLAKGFKQVGKEFPVFLHPKTGEEYALARAERKVRPGYTGFEFDTSPQVSLEDDLRRRDLTINAMAYDEEAGEIIDPFGGRADAYDRILRHASLAFGEDPVRILRVGRFLARFAHLGFHVHPETVRLMNNMVAAGEVNALVAERVWKELERALAEKNPEKFFEVLQQAKALGILFPYLQANGPGVAALVSAASITQDPAIRFAALLHAYPETSTETDARSAIRQLCKRYRVPNQYKELALITATHYETVLKYKSLRAEELLKLFNAVDSFRRQSRFHSFLRATEAIAKSRHLSFKPEPLASLVTQLKQIDVQNIIKAGHEGKALADKLTQERLKVIKAFRK